MYITQSSIQEFQLLNFPPEVCRASLPPGKRNPRPWNQQWAWGRRKEADIYCPDQPKHPTQVQNSSWLLGWGGRIPHCLQTALRVPCSLRPEAVRDGNAAARYHVPHLAMWKQVTICLERKRPTQLSRSKVEKSSSPRRGASPTLLAAGISTPQTLGIDHWNTQVNPEHLLAPETQHSQSPVHTSHMCWYLIQRDRKQDATL